MDDEGSSAARAASIIELWPAEDPAAAKDSDAFSVRFSNDTVDEAGEVLTRPPVVLPILCVATRLRDAIVTDALIQQLPAGEILKSVLQDVADDVDIDILSRCSSGAKVGPDQRAFVVISAVEQRSVQSLPGALRWADELGALEVLCNDPSMFSADVWHLAVLEHALRIAVDASAVDVLEVLLYALPKLPLLLSQRQRLLTYIFEQNGEGCLNIFIHRFPEATKEIDRLRFTEQGAESLRRRCLYRLWFEPAATASLHHQQHYHHADAPSPPAARAPAAGPEGAEVHLDLRT